MVPGANVTILESAYVKTQMENPEFKAGFINAQNYVGMSEEKVRDYAIVSVKAVSYTHLDVYKRQDQHSLAGSLEVRAAGLSLLPARCLSRHCSGQLCRCGAGLAGSAAGCSQ